MSRITLTLLGCVVAAAAIDVWVHRPVQIDVEQALPGLASVPPEQVEQVMLARGNDRVALNRVEGGWTQDGSDIGSERVGDLLSGFSEGVTFDARVDVGHLEDYGLKSGAGIRVELLGEFGANALYVGRDVAGGSTYVRFPDDDVVYRARVGGQQRFAIFFE
jgi:hypothetical protein